MSYRLFLALGLISASGFAQTPAFKPAPAAGDRTVTIVTGTALKDNTISLCAADTIGNCFTAKTPVALSPYTNTKVLDSTNNTLTLESPLLANEVLCADLGNHKDGIKPQDDLRFLFAYRFDISSIAAKLVPQ